MKKLSLDMNLGLSIGPPGHSWNCSLFSKLSSPPCRFSCVLGMPLTNKIPPSQNIKIPTYPSREHEFQTEVSFQPSTSPAPDIDTHGSSTSPAYIKKENPRPHSQPLAIFTARNLLHSKHQAPLPSNKTGQC